MKPPSRKSCYNFRVTEIVKVLDGDTIDVIIDLGFDLYKKERVRIAGVDTPEKRTRDLEEKALGQDATDWMKEHREASAVAGRVVRARAVGGDVVGCDTHPHGELSRDSVEFRDTVSVK